MSEPAGGLPIEVAEFVDGGDWPQATDLHLLADDVERSL